MTKQLLILSSTILICGILNCRPKTSVDEAALATQGLRVSVQAVSRDTIENRLSLPSVIEPWEQVIVFAKVPGKLVRKNVKEGQGVTKDEVIALVNRDEIGAEINNYQVKAPISGVVAKFMLDPGAAVAPTVPIASLIKMDVVKTTVNVIESEIGQVRIGLRAVINVPAYPKEKFPGMVSNILPTIDPISHTGQVVVRIENPAHRLKPGMSAMVELSLNRHENVVTIPRDAIVEKMGEKYVFLFVNGVARRSDIQTGYNDGMQVEIIKGVNVGDHLVTSDLNVLIDGTKIQISNEK